MKTITVTNEQAILILQCVKRCTTEMCNEISAPGTKYVYPSKYDDLEQLLITRRKIINAIRKD